MNKEKQLAERIAEFLIRENLLAQLMSEDTPFTESEIKAITSALASKGLPQSWCIDIRVDDPRIEGFKRWLQHEAPKAGWDFTNSDKYFGVNTTWGERRHQYLVGMKWWFGALLSLDQFEQMSGVNLMDYMPNKIVQDEVDKVFKTGDKVRLTTLECPEAYFDEENWSEEDDLKLDEVYEVEDYATDSDYGEPVIRLKDHDFEHLASLFEKIPFPESDEPRYSLEQVREAVNQWSLPYVSEKEIEEFLNNPL